ncbi:MAG: dependent oxidoreductase [Verrucomicrobiota bacterium]|jgi:flavin-dependent dehydrogenase
MSAPLVPSPAGVYDVPVVGGGISGRVAAIAAARTGARGLLIEEHGFLDDSLTAMVGVAAAEAARRGVNPAQVPFPAIRERLFQQGAQLPSSKTSAPASTA